MSRITPRRDRASDVRRLQRNQRRPIRPGRVLTAQARIASGHYDRPEVRELLVDVLLGKLLSH